MRIAFPYNTFPGGFLYSIENAFRNLGHETKILSKFNHSFFNKLLRFSQIKPVEKYAKNKKYNLANQDYLHQVLKYKPDIYINYSGGGVSPHVIKAIKEELNCLMITYVADNPCDPDPRRDQLYPMSLKYYDVFLNPEPVWDKIIKNLCVNPKIIRYYGGYEPDYFYPLVDAQISKEDEIKYGCDVSFTGGSYRQSAEGAYRSGILNELKEYDVRIWGDKGWQYRYPFMPKIRDAYQGERLSYENLRKLYKLSKINLNMPSPQIFTSFQPRVFDIAATKGFQIIDHSEKLYNIFPKDLVQTFKSVSELKDKVNYFLKKDNERKEIAENMYSIVKSNYTWESSVKSIIDKIL